MPDETAMSALSEFHFASPWWWLLALPFGVLFWRLARGRLSSGDWRACCDAALLERLLTLRPRRGARLWQFLIAFAGFIVILTLSAPVWERQKQPAYADGSTLVFVLDLSRSMDAVDIKPTRLDRVHFKMRDILDRLDTGRAALVVYARQAFTVTPLTNDMAALGLHLDALGSGLLPEQGSRPDRGLEEALRLLERSDTRGAAVLLITDHAGGDETLAAAARIAKSGNRFAVLGVGTERGAPIRAGNGFLSDGGNMVVAKLDEPGLRALARAGRGAYLHFDAVGDADIDALLAWLEERRDAFELSEARTDLWLHRAPWLLLLVLAPAAMAFRRGCLALLVFAGALAPRPGLALDWSALWLNDDQRAARAYEQEAFEEAAATADDAALRAAAYYRAAEYRAAASALESPRNAGEWYNRGNALARAAEFKGAIGSYLRALELEPDMPDARANLALVRQIQRQMQQQQQQQQGEARESDEDNENQDDAQQAQQQQQQQQQGQGDEEQKDERDEGEQGEEGEEGEEDGEQEGEQESDEDSDLDSEEDADTGDQSIEHELEKIQEERLGNVLRKRFSHENREKKRDARDREASKGW